MKRKRDVIISILIYCLSIGIYLHPLTSSPTPSIPPPPSSATSTKQRWNLIYNPTPQLDELHIMHKADHHDIYPKSTTSWIDAWHNDYWGRPLTSESSHKSWRPVSIWSFRFVKGGYMGRYIFAMVGKAIGSFADGILNIFGCGFDINKSSNNNDWKDYNAQQKQQHQLASELFVHRFVNVMIHAAIVQLVGTVATLLFIAHDVNNKENNKQKNNLQLYTKYTSQLLFALHPVHVEAVVNIANRPHILALLFNATIVDPTIPLLMMAILATLGLLTAETAIFQFPAIVLTMTTIQYRQELSLALERGRQHEIKDEEEAEQQSSPLLKTIIKLLPRYVLLVLISITYLLYRQYNDSLSIPNGLIRPAENPFFDKLDKNQWTLMKRAINYSYILSVHILKAFGIDIIGFSHEYGYDCIPEMTSLHDVRLIIPLVLLLVFTGVAAWAFYEWTISRRSNNLQQEAMGLQRVLLTLVFFSWMATLFPISGILKVGTFVADRIAVASSFGTCIFVGRLFAVWIVSADKTNAMNANAKRCTNLLKIFMLFYICTFHLAKRTHNRSAEWMDSVTLMESSLKTCPRSIKSNLETSKLYSGLVPHMLDLDKALSLIRTAEAIDPDYCDVHQQYAHVYFQQQKYISFEEEMVQSLLCSFTMSQAMNNWQQYWKVVLKDGKNAAAQARYDRYMMKIKEEVKKGEMAEEEKKRMMGKGQGSRTKGEL